MSYEASFYGKLISQDATADSYDFEMDDIYVKQKNKRMKEDSFAASKLYTNMEILKAAGSFTFFTLSTVVRDFFYKEEREQHKTFRIYIDAFIGNYQLKVMCFDCEFVSSLVAETVGFGTFQLYDIKFADALIKQEYNPPAPRDWKRRNPMFPVISPVDFGL